MSIGSSTLTALEITVGEDCAAAGLTGSTRGFEIFREPSTAFGERRLG